MGVIKQLQGLLIGSSWTSIVVVMNSGIGGCT